jgi:hypothetical protein
VLKLGLLPVEHRSECRFPLMCERRNRSVAFDVGFVFASQYAADCSRAVPRCCGAHGGTSVIIVPRVAGRMRGGEDVVLICRPVALGADHSALALFTRVGARGSLSGGL